MEVGLIIKLFNRLTVFPLASIITGFGFMILALYGYIQARAYNDTAFCIWCMFTLLMGGCMATFGVVYSSTFE